MCIGLAKLANYTTCCLLASISGLDYVSVEALALTCGMSQKGQWWVWGGCARVVSHARGAGLANEDSEARHEQCRNRLNYAHFQSRK